ncbi:hypothetical protein ID866_9355 [Astraeus odoratus]|nr:hypothetical protein ID866_9355 [Astraeus odoratus]
MNYVPVTRTPPASYRWGVGASMVYGGNIPILDLGPGLLDTGSPTITIDSGSFSAYEAVTGGVLQPSACS